MSATRLQKLQADMKARQHHPGPVAGTGHGALTSIAEYRVKIAAFIELDKGWSVARVAAHLGVNVESLQRWVEGGCRLVD
jgi:Homeodomain-like domain